MSPQHTFETTFPFSMSKIVMYLSVDAPIKNVPDLSSVTQQKS